MSEAEDLLARYLQAQQNKDLDALVSCWHPDVEVVHPMRPDRNWSGLDTYRRQWKLIWERTPDSRFEVVSRAVVGDFVYLEALTEMSDGTMVPHMNVLQIRDGKIWRGRVYTDKPRRDGVDIDGFAHEVNPASGGDVENQVVRVADREPLPAGLERRGDADNAGIGTTRFLGGEDGPWVYYSERPAGAVIPMHQHRSGRTEFLIEGEIAFRFAEPPEDGSPQETVYGANTMTYVKPGVVYGYTVLRDSRILISFDSEPGINYV